MRSALIALMLTFATQAGAECGKLCDWKWWETATTADVQAELDGGADVMARDEYGGTPLHLVALVGTPEVIQTLLAAGADVMARDENGVTSLHYASTPEVIQALLAAGAEVMARDMYGQTPLHSAARHGSPANIRALIAAGADAKTKNKETKRRGTTPKITKTLKAPKPTGR